MLCSCSSPPIHNLTAPERAEIVVMEAKMNNMSFWEAQQALKKYEDAVAKYYPGCLVLTHEGICLLYAPYNLSAEQLESAMHNATKHSIKILRNGGDALSFELL